MKRETCWLRVALMLLTLILLLSVAVVSAPVPGDAAIAQGYRPWRVMRQQGGIVYFMFEWPARIERYDMDAETWRPEITLGSF